MKINELDYKEIGRMLSDGYYDIFEENRLYWNAEEFENFTECIFFTNNLLNDGDNFIDGDYDVLLDNLYQVYDYVIKNKGKYKSIYKHKQDIDEIIQCLKIYIDENK